MNIFVLNCGSSSLKYRLISMPSGEEILGGEVQRIASKTSEPSRIVHRINSNEEIYVMNIGSYTEAFTEVMNIIEEDYCNAPDIFAHRFVQGGQEFLNDSVVGINDIPSLEQLADLAPIHNPPVIEIIKECNKKYPDIPQAIILDSAFHSTIPDYAFTYPIPKDLSAELGIRKFGFHGISHNYVAEEASNWLNKPMDKFNAVSCHLGSGGASLCAIVNGKSVDNSMGFSPMQGLVMSTRCGDMDPAVILKMIANNTGDFSLVNNILNKKSGVLGLSGSSSDIRDIIHKAEKSEDLKSQTTIDVYLWRIKKYLGAYLTLVSSMGKVDAIIFTDTIGELVPSVRQSVCCDLDFFGVRLDESKNKSISGYPVDIAAANSDVRILVIKTNEEVAIAKRAYKLFVSIKERC